MCPTPHRSLCALRGHGSAPRRCLQDLLGRYVVRGYGSVLIPTVPGRYVRYVRCFTPVASTMLQGLLGWLTGSTPEVRAP